MAYLFQGGASSRFVFLHKFREFLKENSSALPRVIILLLQIILTLYTDTNYKNLYDQDVSLNVL